MQLINPPAITAPASRYSQGVLVSAQAKRLVVSGQVGMQKDGTLAIGLEAQLRQVWQNLDAVLRAGGMDLADLIKITGYVIDPGAIGLFRQIRDEFLKEHKPASTLVVVVGLVSPAMLVEIEAEAVRE